MKRQFSRLVLGLSRAIFTQKSTPAVCLIKQSRITRRSDSVSDNIDRKLEVSNQGLEGSKATFSCIFQAVLNETSYGLHRLTQRQGLIKEFHIILPKSWNVPSCQPGRSQMTSVQNPTRPDIFIDAKANRGRGQPPRPWTEQPQGCGQPGLAIHLPSPFVDLGSNNKVYKDSWELRTKGERVCLYLLIRVF